MSKMMHPKPLGDRPKPEVVTVGTVNVDLILGPQEPWPTPGTEVILPDAAMREGGGAGITALALDALGVEQRMVVNVGRDLFGDWLRQRYPTLEHDWIIDDVDTALTIGITHPDGERTFFSTPGHVAVFKPDDILGKLDEMDLNGVPVLFVGTSLMPTIRPKLREIFRFVRAKGGLVALDTAWPTEGWTDAGRQAVMDLLPEISVMLLNEVETEGLLGSGDPDYQAVLENMPDEALFITKMGAKGARIDRLGKEALMSPASRIQLCDTIGAGDSFNAGFLAALARGHGLESCLQVAIQTAGLAISSNPRRYLGGVETGLLNAGAERLKQRTLSL